VSAQISSFWGCRFFCPDLSKDRGNTNCRLNQTPSSFCEKEEEVRRSAGAFVITRLEIDAKHNGNNIFLRLVVDTEPAGPIFYLVGRAASSDRSWECIYQRARKIFHGRAQVAPRSHLRPRFDGGTMATHANSFDLPIVRMNEPLTISTKCAPPLQLLA
jgi:hypothetical protein